MMNIKLNPELERFVREQVDAGNYADESAVVEAALLAQRLDLAGIADIPGGVPWTQETLRAAIQVGIDQADRGELLEFTADDVMAEGRQRLAREREGKKVG